jgi:predicted nucleic acid-binding protein
MRAVTNATPLIALALLGRLDLLRDLFDEVLVPCAVYDEVVKAGEGRPGAGMIAEAGWLQIVRPMTAPSIEPMLLGLDAGEMEVLLLAREQQPAWALIDERQARRVARAMGLPVKGTLGLLLSAVLAGCMSRDEALRALARLTERGIRISPQWQAWLREELARSASDSGQLHEVVPGS